MFKPHSNARLIAFYLPQFHPIPENDEWWGKGFTEWTNVAKAKPLFRGHYQPRIPADLGFYDLRSPEARWAQANLAREHGIEGFCYWHYWFAGERLLERPFNEVLKSGEPDFRFCLAWANETWTGIWYGAPNRVLKAQTYPGLKDYELHFNTLLEAFADSRYITVDGKPIFMIYRPIKLPDARKVTDYWRNLALKAGLKGLHLIAQLESSEYTDWNPEANGFDAATLCNQSKILQVTPKDALKRFRRRLLSDSRIQAFYSEKLRRPFRLYLYEEALPHFVVDDDLRFEYYPCIIPGWDNTPRCGLNGLVLHNSTPELFRTQVRAALNVNAKKPMDRRIIFIKSWNEWAEGNYLEPDQKFGRDYLQVIKDEVCASTHVCSKISPSSKEEMPSPSAASKEIAISTELSVPMPPLEFRQMVGPPDLEFFDNPNGAVIFSELPVEAYDSVFDFGCGCGRLARQLLQQTVRPHRYVGIDIHRGMIDWCIHNLSVVDPNFEFFHHDVYSPGYGAGNSFKLAEPFPTNDADFSLVIANSVFTHMYKEQAEYYLYEIGRILKPAGVALTSWFFFDNDSFPFLKDGPFCLFTNEVDPTQAVIYDRKWFISAVRRCGLAVERTVLPPIAGHQWQVYLKKRTLDTFDRFPLEEEGAEWLSGASKRPIAKSLMVQAEEQKYRVENDVEKQKSLAGSNGSRAFSNRPPIPTLTGAIAELAATKNKLADMERSWSWRIGRAATLPLRVIKRISRLF